MKTETPINGFEVKHNNATLLVVNVEDKFVGITITESGPRPFEMRRVGLEISDVDALRLLRDFLTQQIERQQP